MATGSLDLPVVDLACPDLPSTAESIRKACVESGFFYVTNHGIERGLLAALFAESKGFFALPLEEKTKLLRNSSHRGYTAPYAEKLDASSEFQECFPSWKETMKLYHATALVTGKRILSLIALSLDLLNSFRTLVHSTAHQQLFGYCTTQICREKDRHPQLWEDVPHIDGALIVNIGDLLERWTNCRFRSTLHRVVAVGKERYSNIWWEIWNCDPGNSNDRPRAQMTSRTTGAQATRHGWCLPRATPASSERRVLRTRLPGDASFGRRVLRVMLPSGDAPPEHLPCSGQSGGAQVRGSATQPYSRIHQAAFFLDPSPDLVVQCLESCCCEAYPPRFPPIKSGDYLKERLSATYK